MMHRAGSAKDSGIELVRLMLHDISRDMWNVFLQRHPDLAAQQKTRGRGCLRRHWLKVTFSWNLGGPHRSLVAPESRLSSPEVRW